MIIHILAGGPQDLLPKLDIYRDPNAVWAGVDKGVLILIKMGITPDIAFGDFDSVSKEEINIIEQKGLNIKRYRPEKDETDMELALNWAISQKPERIRIFGATGGRLDHFFGNVQLLVNPVLTNEHIEIELIDQRNMLSVKGPGSYSINKIQEFKYVSFIPLTMEVMNLTLNGFKYPLENKKISMGSTLCISNELINEYGNFSFSKGILLVVRSND